MSTYLYLQKYRNTMYSKIKNYTTMFTKYTLPLGPICTSPLVCLNGMYVIFIYLYSYFCFPSPKKCSNKIKGPSPFLLWHLLQGWWRFLLAWKPMVRSSQPGDISLHLDSTLHPWHLAALCFPSSTGSRTCERAQTGTEQSVCPPNARGTACSTGVCCRVLRSPECFEGALGPCLARGGCLHQTHLSAPASSDSWRTATVDCCCSS